MEINEMILEAAKIFDSDNAESFMISAGTKSLMLSAPHSVEQLRRGQIKYRESEVGALAVVLSDVFGCHAIYKTRNMNDDANYDKTSDYRDALAEYIAENKIKVLFDLHQMASHREQLVCIGTGFGKNLMGREDLASAAVQAFETQGISHVYIDTPFAASYPFTVSSDIAQRCEIPCLQIEINSSLLSMDSEKRCVEKIFSALEALLKWAESNV